MGFTHVQGNGNDTSGNGSVGLGANPTKGNLVCVGVNTDSATITVTSVKDANNNVYQETPNSPSGFASGVGTTSLFWLIAPANASSTINVTFSAGGTSNAISADEFSFSGGTATFDKDIAATGSGATVNTPSITPTNSGSLVYAYISSLDVTAPTAGGTLGAWTGSGGGFVANEDGAEYILNQANSAIAVDATLGGSAPWAAMAMAFYLGNLESFIDTYSITL
jgi:hypothetical protein